MRSGGAGALLALAAASWLVASQAVTQEPTDYAVKAAYILNFARYAEWPVDAPANSEASLNVCTTGRAVPFGGALSAIEGRPIHGREVRFDVNLPALRKAQVKLRADVLRLAHAVLGARS
jgi:hypothetical protein